MTALVGPLPSPSTAASCATHSGSTPRPAPRCCCTAATATAGGTQHHCVTCNEPFPCSTRALLREALWPYPSREDYPL